MVSRGTHLVKRVKPPHQGSLLIQLFQAACCDYCYDAELSYGTNQGISVLVILNLTRFLMTWCKSHRICFPIVTTLIDVIRSLPHSLLGRNHERTCANDEECLPIDLMLLVLLCHKHGSVPLVQVGFKCCPKTSHLSIPKALVGMHLCWSEVHTSLGHLIHMLSCHLIHLSY